MTLKQIQNYTIGVLKGWFKNKSTLDKISENEDGKILFNEEKVIDVDTELNAGSVNPVANNVIASQFNEIDGKLDKVFQSVSDGKGKVAAAITDKGIETAADATFETMATNISNLSSGSVNISSGGGWSGDIAIPCHVDTELAETLTLSSVELVDENNKISDISKVGALDFNLICSSALAMTDTLKVRGLDTLFLNKNGKTNQIDIAIKEAIYIDSSYIGDTTEFTWFTNGSKVDDKSYYITCDLDYWKDFGTQFEVNTNCYVKIGSKAININHRDGNAYYLGYKYITLPNGMKALKIYYRGHSKYGENSSNYRQIWELYLIDNGAVMIYMTQKASNYWTGSFSVNGTSWDRDKTGPISFYPTSATTYDVVYDYLNVSKTVTTT